MSLINTKILAHTLNQAAQSLKTLSPITEEYPDLNVAQAYEIQRQLLKNHWARGEKIVGYKMGLTSQEKQQQMQVTSPIFGTLTDAMQITNGASIDLNNFIQAKVEPEIAFIISNDISKPLNETELLAACSGICPALEIIDSRFHHFKFTLPDVIADNCSAKGFVLGKIMPIPKALNNLNLQLFNHQTLLAQANSSAVLNNPLYSVMALIELLTQSGQVLKAGSIVLSGAATQAFSLTSNMSIELKAEELGSVKLKIQ